ncbi:MAG: hypothetical protein KGI69_01025 [Patescibacteria group bacterium]|nr:hypothetical protein [Patescibacteria group bacterium]
MAQAYKNMKIKSSTIIRIGLAFAFLANSLTAFISPNDFKELLDATFISGLLPFLASPAFIYVIGINDALVSVLLFSGGRRARIIEWWALLWLIGVLIIKATGGNYFDALEEVGFAAMALAIIVHGRHTRQDIHS